MFPNAQAGNNYFRRNITKNSCPVQARKIGCSLKAGKRCLRVVLNFVSVWFPGIHCISDPFWKPGSLCHGSRPCVYLALRFQSFQSLILMHRIQDTATYPEYHPRQFQARCLHRASLSLLRKPIHKRHTYRFSLTNLRHIPGISNRY